MIRSYCALAAILLFAQCTETSTNKTGSEVKNVKAAKEEEPKAPAKVYTPLSTSYRLLTAKDTIRHIDKYFTPAQQSVLFAVNRVDSANITRRDTLIVPADMSGELNSYSPYPASLKFLNGVHKIIFFSYPAQYFAAYENGYLVLSGPTSMGRKKDPTPTGIFYTNWKAEETRSTFNDEWELKWNFNIQNKEGIGFHQYALPGYPASHSCLRLLESDAKYLYNWADQWIIKGTDDIKAHGTPVVVFGTYPFGSPRPWLQLAKDPHALDMTEETLQKETASYLPDIMAKQQQRDAMAAKAQ